MVAAATPANNTPAPADTPSPKPRALLLLALPLLRRDDLYAIGDA